MSSGGEQSATANRSKDIPVLPFGEGPANPAVLPYRCVDCVGQADPCVPMFELADSSIIVTFKHTPAQHVWLDVAHAPQSLGPETLGAHAVVVVDDDLLILHCDGNQVERTGTVSWKTNRLRGPWAAVVVGRTVLISCDGFDTENDVRVVRLDIQTGAVLGVLGKYMIDDPAGIAVGPDGIIYVAEPRRGDLKVFDSTGTLVRVIGQGLLRWPLGVCVDHRNRVYVACHDSQSVVVMDESGALLADFAVPGQAMGVLVTRAGKIVVSLWNGPSPLIVLSL